VVVSSNIDNPTPPCFVLKTTAAGSRETLALINQTSHRNISKDRNLSIQYPEDIKTQCHQYCLQLPGKHNVMMKQQLQ
jgi:hypothetical protein